MVVAEYAGFATLVAVTVTGCSAFTVTGAVYRPVVLMLPNPAGLMDQPRPDVPTFDADAVSCSDCPGYTTDQPGETLIDTAGESVIVVLPVSVVSATLVAVTGTVKVPLITI